MNSLELNIKITNIFTAVKICISSLKTKILIPADHNQQAIHRSFSIEHHTLFSYWFSRIFHNNKIIPNSCTIIHLICHLQFICILQISWSVKLKVQVKFQTSQKHKPTSNQTNIHIFKYWEDQSRLKCPSLDHITVNSHPSWNRCSFSKIVVLIPVRIYNTIIILYFLYFPLFFFYFFRKM